MMKRALPIALAVAVTLALGAAIGVFGWRWYESLGTQPRPQFSLPDLQGERRSISDWDGDIVVLNFWATWCAPCRREIPMFLDLQRTLDERGVQFIGVAVDRRAAVARFADDYAINYPILHGIQAAMDVATRYGNDAGTLPYTVIIGRQGYIRHIFPRQVHRGEIEPVLEAMTRAAAGNR